MRNAQFATITGRIFDFGALIARDAYIDALVAGAPALSPDTLNTIVTAVVGAGGGGESTCRRTA